MSEPHLPTLHEKLGGPSTQLELTTICDPYDLIAVVTHPSRDVQVFRINGQVAYTVKRRSPDVEVTALKFKHDGSVLAIGHSDGICTLHSGENGRFINQIAVRRNQAKDDWKLDLAPEYSDDDDEQLGDTSITCISWRIHLPPNDRNSRSRHASSMRPDSPLDAHHSDNWADEATQRTYEGEEALREHAPKLIGDLVGELTRLDVTKVLPKLPTIPTHGVRQGAAGNLFSSQTTLDGIFESGGDLRRGSSSAVDILFVASANGLTTVLMDDTVKIGESEISGKPVTYCSHQHCPAHAFLSAGDSEPASHRFEYIDLPMEVLGSPYLHVISINTKRMQNLVTYITHTVRCLQHDWETGLQFPTRLMKNISEELEEKQEGDLITNLYHLAMTGNFTKTMEEWLNDVVKETNHKRWEQAVSNMYSHIQNHIFYNLLPALDRLTIATTTLRGHARFHEGTSKFDVSPNLFSNILEGIDSLRFIAQKAQLQIMTEHQQFTAFSKWLRVMVDVAAGANTVSAAETEEREVPNLDYVLVLSYIKDVLPRSPLEPYVGRISISSTTGPCTKAQFLNDPTIKAISQQAVIDAHDQLVSGELAETLRPLINMCALTVFLIGRARVATEGITAWQSRMVPARADSHAVETSGAAELTVVLDMRMVMNVDQAVSRAPSSCTETLFYVENPTFDENPEVLLYRGNQTDVGLQEGNSRGSDKRKIKPSEKIKIPYNLHATDGLDLLDAKFFAPNLILLLLQPSDEDSYLALINVEADIAVDQSAPMLLHAFSRSLGFRPARIFLGGRPDKRFCLAVNPSGRAWKVLDVSRFPQH